MTGSLGFVIEEFGKDATKITAEEDKPERSQ